MSFHDKLYKLINEYADVYRTVTQTQNFKHPFGSFVRHDIVQEITPVVDTDTYLVKGSCGAGRYTTVPWIAVFDKRITTSAQRGVYIVYLLNKDKKELYLTLNQGATDVLQSGSESTDGKLSFTGVTGSSDSSVLFKLRERAEKIRGVVGAVAFNTDSKISCGAPNYDAGAVCYKKYTLDNLPDDTTLVEDLKALVSIYDKYADWYLNAKNNDIKSAFLKFLGSVDSLNGYQKSYKLVLYKVMFDLMDDAGMCSSEEVAKAFRQFYVDRLNAGKVADVDVDKRIELIRDSSVKDVYNVITANPFKVISEKGFMFKTNEPFEREKMCFNADLIAQLSDNDLYEIRQIIDKKLELYFSNIDTDLSLEAEFTLWMKWQPQRKSPALLYKQNTIDTMVSILRKGSAAFNSGDNSVANCFVINDVVAFDDFAQRVYEKATYLDNKYGHHDYRNALEFYYEFLTAKSLKGIDYDKIKTIVDSYEKNFDTIFDGEKYKIAALEQFNDYWDINTTDFADMLEKALSKCANLLTSGNYFAYKGLVEFAQAKPEVVRLLFSKLKANEDLVKCANDFKSQSAAYFEPLGKSTYQDLHAVSVYAFFMYPHKYCIYKSSFYDDFAKVIGYKPEKTELDYNSSRIKNNETLFDAIKCVLSTHSKSLLEKFAQKEQESNLENLSLNYWAFDVLHSIRYGILDASECWPSLEEYSPGFTKDQWLDILNNPEIVGSVWGGVLAMFHTEPEGATCKMLADKFNDSPYSISGKCTNLAKKIHTVTGCPLFTDENGDQEKQSYWPILFQGRDVKGDESGTWMWKLRKELFDALTEFGIEKYLPNMSKEGEKMTIKEKVAAIKNYIASKGFNYEGILLENFYLSLKSKPFVILAGTSGTGKTRLVKLFAEAIDAKMLLVPVRPDWSDSSDLFGHVDLSGKFNPGAILEFIKEAQDNTDKPYFLCLDEMNLARVEYYFSDFLSIIETRENVDGKIVSDPLVDEKYYKKDDEAIKKYGKIIIPENLYIIGTVNMDETTFPFSKKVLDRANTIEFSFVDLMAKPVQSYDEPKQLDEDNSFLKTEYLYLNNVNDENIVTTTCFELEQLNQILLKANLHVGYRVRDEITFYMCNNKNAEGLISETAAFDNQIMQKILPRIQGSSSAIKEVLIEMFRKCAGDYSGLTGSNTYEQMMNCIETKECKYPNSARKIAFMVRRFEEDGFTSYWL